MTNGRQYVAVVAGSGSPFGAGSRIFVPEDWSTPTLRRENTGQPIDFSVKKTT